ncbi:UBX domain-containing protein 7 [Bagarius yarrelli]|uniref:UBX domain-containing protein 7 n=1 Tax=Bagarius yarrelli TaxID=175774 RepID=A0A556V3T0_BAGYA|nr:UBX domain-containing protein 7 [Bagarius yarrelli]
MRIVVVVDSGGKMAALGDASGPGLNGLIQQFTAITGATESVGRHMLEACNNNLEMAVTMFLDGGGIPEEPSTSSGSAAASGSRCHSEDEVRAPIPQKQEILVEPEPLFGVPKRRRPARSIFDGFRDFQTETSKFSEMLLHVTPEREQELRNGGAMDKKLSTLADLFRPPIELMHKGSFETAKNCGQLENKWLMINIQNVQDFSCQCLNRDVWSNEAVKAIIREHFIFWQVYHDSEEGQRYIQFYKLNKFPYISILDPRTGFLTEHGQLDGLSSQPPAKRARSESLIDASEDSQLEAAIRASLQETHYDSKQEKAESENDSDAEAFSDSEGMISVDGSDSEGAGKDSIDGNTSSEQALPTSSDIPAQNRKSPYKESNHRKEESKKNHVEPSLRPSLEPAASQQQHHYDQSHKITSTQSTQPEDNGPKARLMLRYPDGRREQISLSANAKLMALVRHVQSNGYPNERFELVTNFPRRKLAHLDYDITLKEAGLCPQETVFVQERN